jgi:signal transduction histidine kinase/PAS domain-containing protein
VTSGHSQYRWIGKALITELQRGLAAGILYALLGQRHGAKSWVIELLIAEINCIPQQNRPRTVQLEWNLNQTRSQEEFLHHLAELLRLPSSNRPDSDARLSGCIEALFTEALEADGRPVWVFVQDVLGLPKQIARELLAAFNALHEQLAEKGHKRKFGVVVTGSSDVTSLTIGPNSPFRHATTLVVRGLDVEYGRTFFIDRRKHLFSVSTDPDVPDEVYAYLYKVTEGNPHLLQELATAPAHHPWVSPDGGDVYQTVRGAEHMVAHYIEKFMGDDHFSTCMVRETQRNFEWFEIVLKVLNNEGYRFPKGNPHGLEICGLLAREKDRSARFSCEMIHKFVEQCLNLRHVADIYTSLRRWDLAWPAYERMELEAPNLIDRPMSGYAWEHLDASIMVWKDHLMDEAQRSVADVVNHFMKGMRHLFYFDRCGLMSCDDRQWVPNTTVGHDMVDVAAPDEIFVSSSKTLLIGGGQLTVWCNINGSGLLRDWPKSVLFLQRDRHGREIDTAEKSVLQDAIDRFSQAYRAAEDMEYQRRVGALRAKHLKVIERVNEAVYAVPCDMGKVADHTTEALVKLGGCRRVLLTLVNARFDRVQAVAWDCQEGEVAFDLRPSVGSQTNYELRDESSDVQTWVVMTGQVAEVPDAPNWPNTPFKINRTQVERLGIKAFTVVPLTTGNTVIGTLHIERADKAPLDRHELHLYQILAGHIAGVFKQAQRLDLLHAAVEALEDEIRILDPRFNMVYVNAAAVESDHGLRPGWQDAAVPYNWSGHGWAQNWPEQHDIEAKTEQGNSARYFPTSREGTEPRAEWLQVSRIYDFRRNSNERFEADGFIGLVEHIRDMTPLFQQFHDLSEWLRRETVAAAAEAIVETFVKRDYPWCRILLFREDDEQTRNLELYHTLGLDGSQPSGLRNGTSTPHRETMRPTLASELALNRKCPVIVEWWAEQVTMSSVITKAEDFEGAPKYYSGTPLDDVMYKGAPVTSWIEAPLMVGDRAIGVMEMALPSMPLTPRRWALLGNFVQTAALTLDGMMRSEDKTAIERHTAQAMIWIFHQIRQPLTNCREIYRLLELDIALDHPAHQWLVALDQALLKIERLSADYRYFIRPYHPTLSQSDIVAALQQTCHNARVYDHNIEIRNDIRLDQLMIWSDVDELARIVDELIYNAIRAFQTFESNEMRVVSIDLDTTQAGYITISVVDNGPGIPEDVRHRLYVADPEKARAGTGFGLATVHEHLAALDAKISNKDVAPHGTRFAITVPTKTDTLPEEKLS